MVSYFLVITSGFAVVWGFRAFSDSGEKKISEFEYAGFSTFWGSLVFILFIWILKNKSDILLGALSYPFTATPTLFLLGGITGASTGWIFKHTHELRTWLQSKL
ncbi:MAG: hypothetical protein LiPW30_299 [Parcubacteria group bacterium LiPW_30]|nr:MAG: hypothetical protein LiPW30_299 [Parcubacteria group bacterium LiPW_30]